MVCLMAKISFRPRLSLMNKCLSENKGTRFYEAETFQTGILIVNPVVCLNKLELGLNSCYSCRKPKDTCAKTWLEAEVGKRQRHFKGQKTYYHPNEMPA